MISRPTAPVETAPSGRSAGGGQKDAATYQMEEEGRRYRQTVDRTSIEKQTAFNGAMNILPHLGELKLNKSVQDELELFIHEAIKWGRTAINAGVTPQETLKPKGKSSSASQPSESGILEFKDGVELFNYAMKEKGMKLEDIKRILSVTGPNDIKNTKSAAAVLFSPAPGNINF